MKQKKTGIDRRSFLKYVGATGIMTSSLGFPNFLRGAEQDPIKIAQINPLSGPMATAGLNWQQGHELAIKQINDAGGVKALGGRKLTLLNGDTEGKPELGSSETERVIKAGAVAVVGFWTSAVAMVGSQVCEKYHVPCFHFSSADQVVDRGFKFCFGIIPPISRRPAMVSEQYRWMFEVMGVKPKRAALLMVDTDYGQGTARGLKEIWKKTGEMEVVADVSYPLQTADITSEMTKIKAARPEVVFQTGHLPDGILIARALYQLRVDVMGLLGAMSASYQEPAFISELSKLSEYIFNCTFGGLDNENPAVKEVADRFQKMFNKPYNLISQHAYNTTYIIADALERAGSANPEALRDAVAKTNLLLKLRPVGPVLFDEKGVDINSKPVLLQILDGDYRIVGPKGVERRKPVFPVPKWSQRKI